MASENYQKLFEMHAIESLEKQRAFLDVYPKQEYKFHKPSGQLDLVESRVSFAVQVLGIEDFVSGIWRWGWADAISDFPKRSLQYARKIRELGEQNRIKEFTKGESSLDKVNAIDIAMIGTGLCRATAYWAFGKADQFAVHVLITPDQATVNLDHSPSQVIAAIQNAIQMLDLKGHRKAIKYFLKHVGYECIFTGQTLEATKDGSSALMVSFDDLDRLTNIEPTLVNQG